MGPKGFLPPPPHKESLSQVDHREIENIYLVDHIGNFDQVHHVNNVKFVDHV